MTAASDLCLELIAVEKSFGGVQALRGADLAAKRGEILGLCGENGAGKSTLLKVLSGVYDHASYRGTVRVNGRERRFASTRDAQAAGIAIVHQELMLVPELSVAANLMLGRERTSLGVIDDDALEANARALLDKFGVAGDIDESIAVGTLGIGLQQVVEIIRALSVIGDVRANDSATKILILDEPTAALTQRETERLMKWLRQLKAEGTTCIYVSHRMDEVFDICDHITVLRDGKTVGTVDAKTTNPGEVVSMMVGKALAQATRRALRREPDTSAAPALVLDNVSIPLGKTAREEEGARNYAVEKLSLSVARGEIVAICGAMGAGRTALLTSLFGCARHGFTGSVQIAGKAVALTSPQDAIAAGVTLVPEDRKGQGLVLGMTVAENLAMPPAKSRVSRALEWLGLVDEDADEALAQKRIGELKIRGRGESEVMTLSGGNQQKVALGKWLEQLDATGDARAHVLLLDEPTRGVDVGAREEIYGIVERLTEHGTAVLFASSDLPEVLRLADRIVVLRHGRVVGELAGKTASEKDIVTLATGAGTGAAAGSVTERSTTSAVGQSLAKALGDSQPCLQ